MLTNTFCHMPSISLKKEMDLWNQGILTWEDYRRNIITNVSLDESEEHLKNKNPAFFAATLDSDLYWRLIPDFRDTIAYVDIETTGLSRSYNEITTIALYNGKEVYTYVNGKNLSQFKTDILNYKMIVTFNGKTFDLPFIESYLGITLDHPHIDLRYPLKKLGLTGGLKIIEQRLGIDRGDLRSVDGFFAVTLWQEYKRKKNEKALETLLAYNCADVVNLEHLLMYVYNKNLETTPFNNQELLQEPKEFKIPFQADKKLIDSLL